MLDDTNQLAENKLILLYLLDRIGMNITRNQLTEIVLENNLVNYFLLQQYITELQNANFLVTIKKNKSKVLSLTEQGKKVLSLFISRIPEDVVEKIEKYIDEKISNIKKEIFLHADYTIEEIMFYSTFKGSRERSNPY